VDKELTIKFKQEEKREGWLSFENKKRVENF
jgi:hypothetical protein